jgi:phage shock protein A
MRDALQKLQRLQRELKHLHRTTAQVIEESQRLIDDLDKGASQSAPLPVRAKPARRRALSRGPRT